MFVSGVFPTTAICIERPLSLAKVFELCIAEIEKTAPAGEGPAKSGCTIM